MTSPPVPIPTPTEESPPWDWFRWQTLTWKATCVDDIAPSIMLVRGEHALMRFQYFNVNRVNALISMAAAVALSDCDTLMAAFDVRAWNLTGEQARQVPKGREAAVQWLKANIPPVDELIVISCSLDKASIAEAFEYRVVDGQVQWLQRTATDSFSDALSDETVVGPLERMLSLPRIERAPELAKHPDRKDWLAVRGSMDAYSAYAAHSRLPSGGMAIELIADDIPREEAPILKSAFDESVRTLLAGNPHVIGRNFMEGR